MHWPRNGVPGWRARQLAVMRTARADHASKLQLHCFARWNCGGGGAVDDAPERVLNGHSSCVSTDAAGPDAARRRAEPVLTRHDAVLSQS